MNTGTQRSSLLVVFLLAACATGLVTVPRPETGPAALSAVRSPFVEPPGAFSADISQANIGTTICVSGWTATVRPPTSYTQHLKQTMLARVGLKPSESLKYELDHFVPLALGGHPRSEDNLWLQSWVGEWNARIKDRLERKQQVLVCAGRLSLDTARTAIQRDWRAAYREYLVPDLARERGKSWSNEGERACASPSSRYVARRGARRSSLARALPNLRGSRTTGRTA